ncbi:hypothetical protein [Streptomyces hydrogenans]|uniref:hypothetical protein n=1 Tax=Streptomyces hydrogenans TaxID=1873719 RepID=UPI003429B88E
MTTTHTPPPPHRQRTIVRIHFHPAHQTDPLYEQLLGVLEGISPRVEAPSASTT